MDVENCWLLPRPHFPTLLNSMFGHKMMIPPKPERFEILCHDIGLALLLGQNVQFALAHYFSVSHAVRAGWNKSQLQQKIRHYLSIPMGAVVSDIKQKAPLPGDLTAKVDEFKASRNWLVHDFDEEATPYIWRGLKIDDYIARMGQIANSAMEIMNELDEIGDELMREKGVDPLEIKRISEERLNNDPTTGCT